MLDIKKTDTGICFKIYVQPKASKNTIVGLHDDALKIRLTAPPVDGAANKLCIKYLSKITGISKAAFEIASGHTSRTKQILIHCQEDNLSCEKAAAIIKKLINTKTS
ncbi:MAG: YggU family protein [Desulfobacteraceae bacterium]|nr:YggU family protein [Desulfobacteraceae bacterium]MBC2754206.1 YggU family protein [Desulfobacteraceae bacterium]